MGMTVTMPQLGETVTEGTILSWAKQPGDTIGEDEVLLEISTDKVDTEVPSPVAGVLEQILVAEGETVPVGTPLAVIAEPGEVISAAPEAAPATEPAAASSATRAPAAASAAPVAAAVAVAATAAAAAAAEPSPAPSPLPTGDAPRRGILSPVVRKIAADHDVDLALVEGTGGGGRITRKDVEAYVASGGAAAVAAAATPQPAPEEPAEAPPATRVTLESAAEAVPVAPVVPPVVPEPAPAPAPPAPAAPPPAAPAVAPAALVSDGDVVEDLSRMRRRIADHMVVAKQTAAHVWTSVEVDFETLELARRPHREAFKATHGFSLTYLPFIGRATIDALEAFPVVNSSLQMEEGKRVIHRGVDLGIAVDLDEEGLVVVTLRGADRFRLKGMAQEIRELATKSRENRLEPDDVVGSTFTITNPGPYGSYMSAPIINLPNVAILSTDTIKKRATVVTLPDGTDTIAIRHIGYLGLTWDHRAFDGSTAVMFLNHIKRAIETWDWEQELK